MMKILFVLILALHGSTGVIYSVNSTLYYQMPPVFHLDNYHGCLSEPEGIYCTAKITLVSDLTNELLNMIRDYSEHRVKHYNHSQLFYGVCITQSCKDYYSDKHKDGDLEKVLEECLNGTLLKKYELKAKISDPLACNTINDQLKLTNLDYVVAAICFTLLMLNVIGTMYDILHIDRKEKKENKFLMMFSIQRNWQRLVCPLDETNSRTECLRGLNGLRTIIAALVIVTHSFIPVINFANNTHQIEVMYDNLWYHTFINGTPIIQVFFIISGFLLAYNIQIKAEKEKITWHKVPMGIWLRWLRLTSTYALVLAITSTWLRFAGSGPLWHESVITEVEDCRRTGWLNLLYINNYFDNTKCMEETWYLAADMQLYCLGLCVCTLLKTNTARKYALSFIFAVGVIIPGVITYIMDLDGVFIISPESSRSYFILDATFNYIYKRGHTNIPSYVIGLSAGFITYHLMEVKFDVQKYKKYLWTYQLLLPTGFMITWMGSVFYRDAPRDSVYVRTVYATLIKPIFALVMALFVVGLIFKCDKFYRQVLEWRLWTTTARLSYCAFILHTMVIFKFAGSSDTLMTVLFSHVVHFCVSAVIITFLLATPLWLMVEAPMSGLVKLLLSPSPQEVEKVTMTIKEN